MNYRDYIRTVEGYPKPGIKFYDIAPLLGNGAIFSSAVKDLAEPLRGKVTRIVALDARGFVFGSPVAVELGVGITMLRKPGKLPGETIKVGYDLEYGSSAIELQRDALTSQDAVGLIDDVIATGGTLSAGIEAIHEAGASIVEVSSAIDLSFLGGSDKIRTMGIPVRSLVSYDN